MTKGIGKIKRLNDDIPQEVYKPFFFSKIMLKILLIFTICAILAIVGVVYNNIEGARLSKERNKNITEMQQLGSTASQVTDVRMKSNQFIETNMTRINKALKMAKEMGYDYDILDVGRGGNPEEFIEKIETEYGTKKVTASSNINNGGVDVKARPFQDESIFRFDMNDNQNQSYNVFIYADDTKTTVTEGSMTNYSGDILKRGKFKIGYLNKGSNQLQNYQEGEFSKEHTFNVTHPEVRCINNKQADQPDILVVGSPATSQSYYITIFWINNNVLTPIKFDYKGDYNYENLSHATSKGPWFSQLGNDNFETSYYANAEEIGFHIVTWKFDRVNNVFHFLSDRKVAALS